MANTLRFKRGLVSGIPTALAGEPLFTTDTFDLYIGNGTTNTRFQKYIASGATTQILRGDGSLYSFPLNISSPSTNQILRFDGTNWINSNEGAGTGTVTSVAMTVPTGLSISGSPITTSGTLALTFTAGYSIPTTAKQTEWDTAYTNRITSLTTTGSSGAATLITNTLNIPNYTLSGLGGVPTSRTLTINGTAFDLTADRSWSVGTVTSVGLSSATSGVTIGSTPITTSGTITIAIAIATSGTNGLLSSTDWSTFNNKQPQLNGTGFVKASGTTITYDNSTYLTTSSASSTYLPLAGGTMTGFITLNADPTQALHAVTKQYVDAIAEGLHVHASCEAATPNTLASITGGTVTYNNGTSGVGATLTLSVALTTLDGVTLANGNRILVKNEATSANNGVYTRTSSTILTRATDFDTPTEIAGGDFIFVTGGTLYNDTGWVQIQPCNTVGTDAINFNQFSGAGTYLAGTGLTLTGNTFSANIGTDIQGLITLTTTGTSGAATFNGTTLNIPQYSGTNIYNSDGTLTANRTVSSGGFTLTLNPVITFGERITGIGAKTITTDFSGTTSTSNFSFYLDNISTIDGSASSQPQVLGFRHYLTNTGASGNNALIGWGIYPNQFIRGLTTGAIIGLRNVISQTRSDASDVSTSGSNYMEGLAINQTHFNTAGANIVTGNFWGFRHNTSVRTGTVTNIFGHTSDISISNFATGNNSTVSNYYGFYTSGTIGVATGPTGTVSNYYGLYLNTLTVNTTGVVTNRWGVYAPDTAMRHYLNGNLLVGTTTDSGEKLQVSGTSKFTDAATFSSSVTAGARSFIIGAAGYLFDVQENSANKTRLQLYVDTAEVALISGYDTTAKPMTFYTSGVKRATLDISGNLALSNLAGTGTRMVVADASGILSTQAIPGGGTGSPGGSNGYVQFNSSGTFGGDANLFWDDTNKRLGVGTATPSGQLDISKAGDSYVNILSTTLGTSSVLSMYNSNGTTDGAAIGYNVAMRFGTITGTNATGFSERARITSGGNLLIGTQTNGRKLTVFTSTQDDHVLISGTGPSVAMTDTVTGATYQTKFGLATASNQFATGSVAGDFVISNQTGAIIWALNSVMKMQLKTTSQLQLHAYTSTTSFTGTAAGVLAFDASGNIITIATPSGSGTVTSVALASGTSGSDVNITGSPITSSGTITLNIPDAGASARGLMTTGTQTIAGQKTFSGGIVETRINPRSITNTSTSTLTPNVSTDDFFTLTAQAATLTLANPTGTPVDGQKIIVRIFGTSAQTINYGTEYRGSTDLPLPTTTSAGKTVYLGFMYNTIGSGSVGSPVPRWDMIAELDNF